MKTARIFYLAAFLAFAGATGVLASSETKIIASDAEADDSFGISVSVDGDYAIVGAWLENTGGSIAGAAYIFHRTAGNTWDGGTKIMGADTDAGDHFGQSVAISGEYAIVGAPSAYTGSSMTGAVYIFHRTDDTWDAGTKIVASGLEASDAFGLSVGLSGDYAIVGVPYFEDPGGYSTGEAYIYHRTDTNTWDAGTKITSPGTQDSSAFGLSVAISSDNAIVGAPFKDSGGAAYIFHRIDGIWDAGTKIVASDAEASDLFGQSVAISGDYAIVGAVDEDEGGTDAGAAYVFHRTAGITWDTGTKIMASDAEANDQFGISVATSGDYVLVGAYNEDINGTDAGAAYIFQRTGENTWKAGAKILASDTAAGDNFGMSVSLSGDYTIIGAYHEDPGSLSNAGSAYVYQYDPPVAGKLSAFDADSNDSFGISVAISGDYVIAGAPNEDAESTNGGAAYLFHRTDANNWDTGTKITASDIQSSDVFGSSVAISGDYAIAGAPNEDAGGTNAGAAYVFHRTGANTWDMGTKIVAYDAQDYDYFGSSVAISGDYTIVGAYQEDAGGAIAGAAYIFHRTDTNTWDAGIKIMAADPDADDRFGLAVAISDDYAIAGANREDAGGSNTGAAYIFHRTDTNTWDAGIKIVAPDAQDSDHFGWSVAITSDYALVGAPFEDANGNSAGAAYVFHRTDTNAWDVGTKIIASDPEASDNFGGSVSISGPFAIVSAENEDAGGLSAGAAYLFNRTDTNTWSAGTKIMAVDAAANDNYGYSVSIQGYYAIVGAYHDDPGWPTNAGSAYVFEHGLPAAVDLLAFAAEWADGGALLDWITGSETECGAFTLLRCELGEVWASAEPNCPPADFAELDLVIPCEDSAYGAEYEALDATADPNANYSYLLREYETTGGVNDFGPVLLYSVKYGDEAPGGASSDDDENPGDDDAAEPTDDDAQSLDDDETDDASADSEDAEEDDGAGCGM